MFLPVLLVGATAFMPLPGIVDDVLTSGTVDRDDSMHRAVWFVPAVADLREDFGADARVAEVSVYRDRLAFDVDHDGRTTVYASDWKSPRRLQAVPSPGVPTGATFPASAIDPLAPERIVQAIERRLGTGYAISLMRLEPPIGGGAPVWTVNGFADDGRGGPFTASIDGRQVRSGL
jgi:hypothetical protein